MTVIRLMDVARPWGRRRARTKQRGTCVGFQDPCFGIFRLLRWGAHPIGRLTLSVDEWITKKEFFDAQHEALQLHEPELNTTDEIDVTNLIETKAEFSKAVAVWMSSGQEEKLGDRSCQLQHNFAES